MNDFYVRDVDFGSAYNALQAPVLLSWVAANQGFVPPDPGRPFTYCDLGCGNGLTLNGLAAVHPESRFVGIDFNEGHIEQARQLASEAGVANTEFHVASFSDLSSLGLPQFDFIGMHGIYSWLHPRVVEAVIGFLASHLVSNGLFVVEYLTLPGAAAVAPMWKLMRELTSHRGGSPTERAAKGLEVLAKLRQHNARYFTDNPRQSGHIEQLHERRHDENLLAWLAHSSLADNWHPKYFTDVSDELAEAGLGFAGSVQLALNDLVLSIPQALRASFDGFREGQVELLKDFALNRSQRTDVFVKRADKDPAGAERFRAEAFCIATCGVQEDALAAVKQIGGALRGEEQSHCLELVDQLCAAEGPLRVGDLVGDERAITRLLLTGLFHVYTQAGPPPNFVSPAREGESLSVPLELNRINLEQAATSLQPTGLVLGNGSCVRLSGLESLALWARVRVQDEHERAAFARASIRDFQGPIHVGGRTTTSDWISDGEIDEALHHFDEHRLPALLRLGVIAAQKPLDSPR